jgi:outer membrane protein
VKIQQIVSGVALALMSTAALSADNVLQVGVSNITVHSKSADFSSNGPAFLTPQPAGINVNDAATISIGYTRHLDQNWDINVLLGIPPKHSIKGRGTLAPFGEITTVKQAGPTFMVNYNFGAAGATWRPYVGAGVNVTHFYDITSTASGNLASGGPTSSTLKNSVGAAAQAGFNLKVMDQWSLNASAAVARVKTDMVASTGSIERKTQIDLRPVVFSVGLSYGF